MDMMETKLLKEKGQNEHTEQHIRTSEDMQLKLKTK